MDSPLASPSKAEFAVGGGTAEDAGPCPRFVTNEELHILQTCLTRWRTEVEHDIKGTLTFLALPFGGEYQPGRGRYILPNTET